jgi:hypothetical protein
MSNNTTDNSYLIHSNDINVLICRCIFCFISWLCCLFLISIYIILILKVKFNFCQKNETNKKDKTNNILNYISVDYPKYAPENNNKTQIGLGSHFIFILTVSNFFGVFFESFFFFYYKNINTNCIGESPSINECIKTFIEINDSQICKLLGLSHHFFDIYSVCWTSMLTLLFYRSRNPDNDMNQKTVKYIIIGFIYSSIVCVVVTLLPYITGENYGFNRFYCTFRFYHDIDSSGKGNSRTETSIWSAAFAVVQISNVIFHIFCLIKTQSFYSEKIKILKKQDKNEYKSFIIFVWVFRLLPIVIIITRLYRFFSRVVIEIIYKSNNENNETSIYIMEYINSFMYSSNGIIISLVSLLFFRGIFTCCSSEKTKEIIKNYENIDMRFLEEEND